MTTHLLIATIDNKPTAAERIDIANQFALHMNTTSHHDNAFYLICPPGLLAQSNDFTETVTAIHTATGITPDVVTGNHNTNSDQEESVNFQHQIPALKQQINTKAKNLSTIDDANCFDELNTTPGAAIQAHLSKLDTIITNNNPKTGYQITLDQNKPWQAINGFWQRTVTLQYHNHIVDQQAHIKIPLNDCTEERVMLITSHLTPFSYDLVESQISELLELAQQLPTQQLQDLEKQADDNNLNKAHLNRRIDTTKATKTILSESNPITPSTHTPTHENEDASKHVENLIKISNSIRKHSAENRKTTKELEKLNHQTTGNQSKIEKLKTELEQLNTQPEADQAAIQELNKKLEQFKVQDKKNQSNRDELNKKLEQLTTTADTLNQQLQQIRSRNDFDTTKVKAIEMLTDQTTNDESQINQLNQKNEAAEEKALILLKSIGKKNEQMEKCFKKIDVAFIETQHQLFDNQQVKAELQNKQDEFKRLWENTFRENPTSRYSFEPPNYHVLQGVFDRNMELKESISSGVERNQFDDCRDAVDDFCKKQPPLDDWTTLISTYAILTGTRSSLYNCLRRLQQDENTSLLVINSITPLIPPISDQLIETRQQYKSWKQHNRDNAHLNIPEIHSLDLMTKTKTWGQWGRENAVPLALFALGLTCVATTVILAAAGAPIIAAMATVPFIHTACVTVAHALGISQTLAQVSVLSGASGLIIPSLTGLLYKLKNVFTKSTSSHSTQQPILESTATTYTVSHPKYSDVTETELETFTPEEKAHLFFHEYTHIINNQPNSLTNSRLLNHLVQDQGLFQYPNRSLALITNSQNKDKFLHHAIKNKSFSDECVRLPLLIDTVLHASKPNNHALTNAIFSSKDRLFEMLLYTRAIIANPNASFQEKKRTQGLLNHVKFNQKLETCQDTTVIQLLNLAMNPSTEAATSLLTQPFCQFQTQILSNKAFTAKIQEGVTDLTQINTEFWNALFGIKNPDSLSTPQISLIKSIVSQLYDPSKQDGDTTQLNETIQYLKEHINQTRESGSLHELLTSIESRIAITPPALSKSLSQTFFASVGWLFSLNVPPAKKTAGETKEETKNDSDHPISTF